MQIDDFELNAQAQPRLRRARRVAFDLMVRFRLWGERGTTVLEDMTPYGARIARLNQVRIGDQITLQLPGLQPKTAEIAWIDGQAAGLEFDHPLHRRVFAQLVRDYAQP
ncbi:MAG: hypothetical protein RLZZ136_1060, partial [Pseudomonadota bacterium]